MQSDEIHQTGGYSTSMTLFLVLLLQFKIMLSGDKYKKSLCTFFYKSPRFLRLTRWFGQKDRKNAKKNWVVKLENRNNFIATQRKSKVSHLLVIVFQWLFILFICVTMPFNRFIFNTTLLWYDLVVFTIFEQVELRPKLNLVYLGHPE